MTRPMVREIAIWAWRGIGGALAVGGMEFAAYMGETPLALVPFATSIVLVLGSPDSDPAQPRALVGGHVLSAAIGVVMLALLGSSPPVAAAAVGMAMLGMRLTGTMHPPAAIDPIIVVVESMPATYVLLPVGTGALLLTLYALAWHNLPQPGSWPRRWR